MPHLSLLEKDFCEQGHDITDKDKSLGMYDHKGRTLLRCKECARMRTRRYYAENIKGKVSEARGKPRAERATLRAKHNTEPRTPSAIKTDALTLALRNEVFALASRLTDAELMELVLELRKRG